MVVTMKMANKDGGNVLKSRIAPDIAISLMYYSDLSNDFLSESKPICESLEPYRKILDFLNFPDVENGWARVRFAAKCEEMMKNPDEHRKISRIFALYRWDQIKKKSQERLVVSGSSERISDVGRQEKDNDERRIFFRSTSDPFRIHSIRVTGGYVIPNSASETNVENKRGVDTDKMSKTAPTNPKTKKGRAFKPSKHATDPTRTNLTKSNKKRDPKNDEKKQRFASKQSEPRKFIAETFFDATDKASKDAKGRKGRDDVRNESLKFFTVDRTRRDRETFTEKFSESSVGSVSSASSSDCGSIPLDIRGYDSSAVVDINMDIGENGVFKASSERSARKDQEGFSALFGLYRFQEEPYGSIQIGRMKVSERFRTGIFVDLGNYINGNASCEQYRIDWSGVLEFVCRRILGLNDGEVPDTSMVFYNVMSDKERFMAWYLRKMFGFDAITSDLLKNDTDIRLSSELRKFVRSASGDRCGQKTMIALLGGDGDYGYDLKWISDSVNDPGVDEVRCELHVVSSERKCSRYLSNLAIRTGGCAWDVSAFMEKVHAYSIRKAYPNIGFEHSDEPGTDEFRALSKQEQAEKPEKIEKDLDVDTDSSDSFPFACGVFGMTGMLTPQLKKRLVEIADNFPASSILYGEDVERIGNAIRSIRDACGQIRIEHLAFGTNDDNAAIKKQALENILNCWIDGKVPTFMRTVAFLVHRQMGSTDVVKTAMNLLVEEGYLSKRQIVIDTSKNDVAETGSILAMVPEVGMLMSC